MELISYKTNITTEAAAWKVASVLSNIVGAANWQINIQSPDKLLTIYSPSRVDDKKVREIIRKAGYKAESMETIQTIY